MTSANTTADVKDLQDYSYQCLHFSKVVTATSSFQRARKGK